MNYSFDIAQPCSFKFTRPNREGVAEVIVKSNTHKPFVLLDELLHPSNFQECVKFHTLEKPIGYFTEVWKAIENTESWAKYEYFLVARDIDIKKLKDLINHGVVWDRFKDFKTGKPLYLPAFGDKIPRNSDRVITYNDDYILVGRAWNCKLLRRRDR